MGDARFGERMRVAYSVDDPAKVRVVLAHDREAIAQLDRDEPVMLTRAAHRKLGTVDLPLMFPHSPTLSPETAQALASLVVRSNLA